MKVRNLPYIRCAVERQEPPARCCLSQPNDCEGGASRQARRNTATPANHIGWFIVCGAISWVAAEKTESTHATLLPRSRNQAKSTVTPSKTALSAVIG